MGKRLHYRLLAPLAIILALVMAPLVIFSLGVGPVDTTLLDYSGGHASSPTCNGALPAGTIIGMAATSDDEGYWVANNQGLVVACGDATSFGGLTSILNAPIVGIAATRDGGGYYLVASDGGIFTFGDAVYQGSTGALKLNKPVVGMAVDPTTGGYWLVASDGGIFSFNAPFYGSTGSMVLNRPIVGMAADVATGGYWLVASDGGIFSFNAPFKGSMGAVTLNKPIVGMAPDVATGGYWLVAADGGIFSFSAPFFGSTGAILLDKPIYGMEANGQGTGYRFVASDGGIFDFGSSAFFGSAVAGITTLPGTAPTTTTTITGPPTTTTPTTTPTTTTTTTMPPTTTTTTTAPVPTFSVIVDADSPGCFTPGTPGRVVGCPIELYVEGSGFAPNATYTATGTFSGTEITPNSDPETIATVSDQALAATTITANSTGAFSAANIYNDQVGDANPYLLLPITDTGSFAPYNDTITITIDGITDEVSNVLTQLVYGPV